jgi:hypothetical protein
MANLPTSEFQNLWSNKIESLVLEYGDTVQHLDAEPVTERVRGVLIAIAHLAERTPAAVGENPKWTLNVQNMAETRRNHHQGLKGK